MHFILLQTACQLVVPTFDTKVTEYLCSGGFFSPDNFRLLQLAIFDGIFLYHSKRFDVLSKKLKDISPKIIIRKAMGV